MMGKLFHVASHEILESNGGRYFSSLAQKLEKSRGRMAKTQCHTYYSRQLEQWVIVVENSAEM